MNTEPLNDYYDSKKGLLRIPGMKNPIIYKSDKMKEVLNDISLFSKYDFPVLITGETGTGKSLIAEALHYLGELHYPKDNPLPFMRVDCGTIETNLVLSELFGHVKGAFTGAIKNKKGCFDEKYGTIFLDEIGNQGEKFQRALLTVIENGEFRPVGNINGPSIKTNTRIIAATNANLEKAMSKGRFRKDLYYRLAGESISLPALCEREEDIPLLTNYFLELYNKILRKK